MQHGASRPDADAAADGGGHGPVDDVTPDAELRRSGTTALVVLAVFNLIDVAVTRILLARGGIELNPLADRLLASNSALVVKLGIVAVLFWRVRHHRSRVPAISFLWFVAGVYAFVVVFNTSQLVSTWNS